jgi:uncharacterized cupredoxin-like copper-binding protein
MRRLAPFIAIALLLACASVALAKTTKRVSASESGSLHFSKSQVKVAAGKVTLKMKNPSGNSLQHSIDIRGHGVNKRGKVVDPGGTSKVTVTLAKGRYTFYCRVEEHEAEGMEGTLVVN